MLTFSSDQISLGELNPVQLGATMTRSLFGSWALSHWPSNDREESLADTHRLSHLSPRWLRPLFAEGALWALLWDRRICVLGPRSQRSPIPLPPATLSSHFQPWSFRGPEKLASRFTIILFPLPWALLLPHKTDHPLCRSKLSPYYTEMTKEWEAASQNTLGTSAVPR